MPDHARRCFLLFINGLFGQAPRTAGDIFRLVSWLSSARFARDPNRFSGAQFTGKRELPFKSVRRALQISVTSGYQGRNNNHGITNMATKESGESNLDRILTLEIVRVTERAAVRGGPAARPGR